MVDHDADSAPQAPRRVVAVIPARAGSRRLPDKPLKLIGGEPLVCRVLRQVRECPEIDEVLVATDDARVARLVREQGARVFFEAASCSCGTERVARAVADTEASHVLNVQVDQAFVKPSALASLIDRLRAGEDIATLAVPLSPERDLDPNAVKVACDPRGQRALGFWRSPRGPSARLHVGVYGFRRHALDAVARLPRSARAAEAELEQLTWMDAGWPISVVHVAYPTLSIDTPEDLAAAQERLE